MTAEVAQPENGGEGSKELVLRAPEPPGQEIRDYLITTAVKFLQNPKVKGTSLSKKQEFLRKKGLTEKEIEFACLEAGACQDDPNNNFALDGSSKVIVPYSSTRTSLLLKAMDVANMIALISIGSYSLYSLWKNYIAPRIFGTRSRLEQKYERLLEAITQLSQNVTELREHMRDLQNQRDSSPRPSEIVELKKEISAIKSLLLGRHQFQFPSPSASTSGIPSWQLVEAADNSNENSDESGRGGPRRVRKERKVDSQDLTGSIRKHPSLDSNNGFQSETSSCEVVILGKTDSSDPDHSHSE